MAKEKKEEGGSHKIVMRRFKVHGSTTQYRQSDGEGGHMETSDATVGPCYFSKEEMFDGKDGPKKLTITVSWK